MQSRLETLAWCLLTVVLFVAGFGLLTVLVVLALALVLRWVGAETSHAYRFLFGRSR